MKPLVTIVIPFYNDPYIDQALQSALSQSYAPIEIIVVDDGSTMHTERIQPYLPHIHYLGKANGGTASALNHGIRFAAGEYIAWLSSDDVFYPDKIHNQIYYMLEHYAWISHTNFNYLNNQSQITHHRAGYICTNDILDFYRSFLEGNPVNGCTVMMKKDLFYRVGMFNEQLTYTHDLDLWRRVIQAGISFPYLDEALVGYRWHDGMGTMKHRSVILEEIAITQRNVIHSLSPIVAAMERQRS
ncbi:glycosyltransferase [Paenibacillus pini]|uniref:Glycosyltransferase n=1 Tax=Paenibacillus pini JCM 16418 TaxID=1236976 RepID=W7YCQ6_9BACL|nr:glycosyltransferase [Paenibacillus pini]GAF08690.1 glycosyltransferase [Paenibacillus pini JCM 16418]